MEQGSGVSTVDRQRLFLYIHRLYESDRASYDRPIYVHLFPRYFPTLVGGRRCWSNITSKQHHPRGQPDQPRLSLFTISRSFISLRIPSSSMHVSYMSTHDTRHIVGKSDSSSQSSPVCCAARLTPEIGGWSPHTGRSASWCTSHDTPRVSRPRHVSSTQLGGECSISWGDSVTHPRPSDTTLELFTPPRSCARARQSARDAAARKRRRVIPAPRRAAAAPAPARSRAAPPRPPAGL